MTSEVRASLAEQLTTNALFETLLSELEAGAVEQMVLAQDDTTRAEGAMYVRAVRSFRHDCNRQLRGKRERKPAPA